MPRTSIQSTCIACWICKTTNIISEYAVLTDFHCKKMLHDCASVSCYSYIACCSLCLSEKNLTLVLFRRVPGHIFVSRFFKTIFGTLSALTCLSQANFHFEVSQPKFCTNLSSLLCQLGFTFATNIISQTRIKVFRDCLCQHCSPSTEISNYYYKKI